MTLKFIKPASPDTLLRNHQKNMRPVPPQGEQVNWDMTWTRRVRDGDAVVFDPDADAKRAKRAEKKAEAPQPETETAELKRSSNKPTTDRG